MIPRPNPAETPADWREVLPAFVAVFALFQLAATWLASNRGEWGLAIAAAVAAALVAIEMAGRRQGLAGALLALGFGPPASPGLAWALPICAAMLASVPLYVLVTGANFTAYPGWAWLLPGLFAQGGIAEEALFRGYLFGRLRRGRSFWNAAWLAAVPFIIVHLYLFATMPWPVAFASVLLATIISFPLARLFELGDGTIWAPALVHFVVQATPKLVEIDTTFPLMWIAVAAVLPFLVFLGRK